MKPIRIRLEILILLAIGQAFMAKPEGKVLAIAPLVGAGIAVGAGKLLGGLFGKRKPELTAEQKFAADQYKRLIEGGGYLPGERELQQQQLSRNIGAQTSLQKSLAAERLAATPGASDTAFGDALLSGYDINSQKALADAFAGMDIAAKQRVLGAIQGIGSIQPGQMSKGNFFDVLGDVSDAAGQPVGYALGQKYSDKNAKTNIKDFDIDKVSQLLNSLDLKTFNYKPPLDDGQKKLGLMSQDSPVPVSNGQSIDMDKLVMLLLAGFQKLSKELELAKKFNARKKEIELTGQS